MEIVRLSVRDFRCYERAEVAIGQGLTVIAGPNGAGKTNLLEALYFGCVGRSCRTANEREVVRFGRSLTRVETRVRAQDGEHLLAVALAPGEAKRFEVDGRTVERLQDVDERPLVSVFLPDRLDLVKGAPSLRRAHLDQLVAALWPARVATRRAYAQALAQRNALLGRIRAGGARSALASWDLQLAGHGVALMSDRAAAVELVAERFAELAGELGLVGEPALLYRPRSRAETPEGLAQELAERLERDLERGFTSHGPHRDDLALQRDGRELRAYGSQGEQRIALLALLLAERAAIADLREAPPVMLLDDVMSELDEERRSRLAAHLRELGQSVVTATELDHVPGARDDDVARIAVAPGGVLEATVAA